MGKSKAPRWAVRRAIKRSIKNCGDKKVYKTIADAEAAVKKFNQRMYICPVCKEYHLTSNMDGY